MLKNRDVPPNPYRVPPQPTPLWVKMSITCLFLNVIALMGAVAAAFLGMRALLISCCEGQRWWSYMHWAYVQVSELCSVKQICFFHQYRI